MPNKKEIKNIFDNMQLESIEAREDINESEEADEVQVASASDIDQVAEEETTAGAETSPLEQVERSEEAVGENSPADPLDDVRKSLIEDEAHEREKQPKWWKRIGRSSHKKGDETETPGEVEEIDLPALNAMPGADVEAEVRDEMDADEYTEQVDELIYLLDKEDLPVQIKSTPPEVEVAVEPVKPIDIEELKKQAFQPRHTDENVENITEVRAIALEGDEEVFVEVESTPHNPLEERLDAFENALKPYQRYINFVIAFLALVVAVAAGLFLYNIYMKSVAAKAVQEPVSNLPFPTTVSLPGGWKFELNKGSLVDGRWDPKGAEWLQGTEVCRWVALPWSRQLEAVIRTLNPDDPIALGMSNNDSLTYKVYTIKQMSPVEMQKLDSNKPCLLIVLAEPDAEKRWVLTSVP